MISMRKQPGSGTAVRRGRGRGVLVYKACRLFEQDFGCTDQCTSAQTKESDCAAVGIRQCAGLRWFLHKDLYECETRECSSSMLSISVCVSVRENLGIVSNRIYGKSQILL